MGYTKYKYCGKFSELYYTDNAVAGGLVVKSLMSKCEYLSHIETFEYIDSIVDNKIFIEGMLNDDYLENKDAYILKDMVRRLKLENVLAYINMKYLLVENPLLNYRELKYIADYIYEMYVTNPTSIRYNAVIHCMDVLINEKFSSETYDANISKAFHSYVNSTIETIRVHASVKINAIKHSNVTTEHIDAICLSLREVDDLSMCHYTASFFNHIIPKLDKVESNMIAKMFNSLVISLSNNDLDLVVSLNMPRMITLIKQCTEIPYRISESISRSRITHRIMRNMNKNHLVDISNCEFRRLSIYQMMMVISDLCDIYTHNETDLIVGGRDECVKHENNEIESILYDLMNDVYIKYGSIRTLGFILNSNYGYIKSMRSLLSMVLKDNVLSDKFIDTNIHITIDELISILTIVGGKRHDNHMINYPAYRFINSVFATNFTKIVHTTKMECIYTDLVAIYFKKYNNLFNRYDSISENVIEASSLITFDQMLMFKEDLTFLVNSRNYDAKYYSDICGIDVRHTDESCKCKYSDKTVKFYVKSLFENGLGTCISGCCEVEQEDKHECEVPSKNIFARIYAKWENFIDSIEK